MVETWKSKIMKKSLHDKDSGVLHKFESAEEVLKGPLCHQFTGTDRYMQSSVVAACCGCTRNAAVSRSTSPRP